jgi:peptidoglycan hydrolase-like protein with peptidoglycan-binding domain
VPERNPRARAVVADDGYESRFEGRWLSFPMAALRVAMRRPADSIGALLAFGLIAAMLVNALYLQSGPHPAPLLAPARSVAPVKEMTGSLVAVPRPAEVKATESDAGDTKRTRLQLITDIQKELLRRGFYDGAVDGAFGPKMGAAIREFEHAAGLRPIGEPTEALLKALTRAPAKVSKSKSTASASPRTKENRSPAAAQSRRITAVQKALTDFGYGPLKLTGTFDASTRAAIEKFERERKLPVKGQVSERLIRELAALTGRPIE